VVQNYGDEILNRERVLSFPRGGSKQQAASKLLDAHVRSRLPYDYLVKPYRAGLLTSGKLQSIIKAIGDELKPNSKAAKASNVARHRSSKWRKRWASISSGRAQ
jgi:hypothetical protein